MTQVYNAYPRFLKVASYSIIAVIILCAFAFWNEMNNSNNKKKNNPLCLSTCHNHSRKLTIILLIFLFVCFSVCSISSPSLSYSAKEEISNYSADSLSYTVCIESAGSNNQWLSLKWPNVCVACVGMYTHVQRHDVASNVLWLSKRWMFAGWWVRRLLYLKSVFALVARSSPGSWCWPYKHVGPWNLCNNVLCVCFGACFSVKVSTAWYLQDRRK